MSSKRGQAQRRAAKTARRKARITRRDRQINDTGQWLPAIPVWDYRNAATNYAAENPGEDSQEILTELVCSPIRLGHPDGTIEIVHLDDGPELVHPADILDHWETQHKVGNLSYENETRTHWIIDPMDPELEQILTERGWNLHFRAYRGTVDSTDEYGWQPSLYKPPRFDMDWFDRTVIEVGINYTDTGAGDLEVHDGLIYKVDYVGVPGLHSDHRYLSRADLLANIDDIEAYRHQQ